MKWFSRQAEDKPYWIAVLDEAMERAKRGKKPFSRRHVKQAEDWTTCACGRQDWRIPRDVEDDSPLDPELKRLGGEFYEAIKGGAPIAARQRLVEIEIRAAEVIRLESARYMIDRADETESLESERIGL